MFGKFLTEDSYKWLTNLLRPLEKLLFDRPLLKNQFLIFEGHSIHVYISLLVSHHICCIILDGMFLSDRDLFACFLSILLSDMNCHPLPRDIWLPLPMNCVNRRVALAMDNVNNNEVTPSLMRICAAFINHNFSLSIQIALTFACPESKIQMHCSIG